jgi:hypothetical protein
MKATPGMLRYMAMVMATSSLLLIALSLSAKFAFGSMHAAVHWIYGYHLFIENPVDEISLTAQQAVNPVQFAFRVVNTSSKKVTVVGASSTCTCSIVDDLPLQVPAKGSASATLTVHPNALPSTETSGSIRLFTDDPDFPVLTMRYRVHIASENQQGK